MSHMLFAPDVIRPLSIQQKTDSLCGRNYAASACALHEFGNRWSCNVFSARKFIALFHCRWQFDIDCVVRIDVRAIDMVRNDAALAGINSGHHGRAVYHRRTGIHRMMVTKSDAFASELPKRRSILLVYKIRTHPIPHDHHYMTLGFRRHGRCDRRADGQKQH